MHGHSAVNIVQHLLLDEPHGLPRRLQLPHFLGTRPLRRVQLPLKQLHTCHMLDPACLQPVAQYPAAVLTPVLPQGHITRVPWTLTWMR